MRALTTHTVFIAKSIAKSRVKYDSNFQIFVGPFLNFEEMVPTGHGDPRLFWQKGLFKSRTHVIAS